MAAAQGHALLKEWRAAPIGLSEDARGLPIADKARVGGRRQGAHAAGALSPFRKDHMTIFEPTYNRYLQALLCCLALAALPACASSSGAPSTDGGTDAGSDHRNPDMGHVTCSGACPAGGIPGHAVHQYR